MLVWNVYDTNFAINLLQKSNSKSRISEKIRKKGSSEYNKLI